jgi:hypothetical protein
MVNGISFNLSYKFVQSFLASALLLVSIPTLSHGAILVSNVGETENFSNFVQRQTSPFTSNVWLAQRFVAGTSTTIGSVALKFSTGGTITGGFRVSLYSNSGSVPGTSLAAFSGTFDPAANSTEEFTGSLAVTAGTSYWVVVNIISPLTGEEYLSATNSTTETGVSGWSIADNIYSSFNGGSIWDPVGSGAQLISISDLTVVPEPSRAFLAFTGFFILALRRRR